MEDSTRVNKRDNSGSSGKVVAYSRGSSAMDEVTYSDGGRSGRPYVNWIAGRAYSLESLDAYLQMLTEARTLLAEGESNG